MDQFAIANELRSFAERVRKLDEEVDLEELEEAVEDMDELIAALEAQGEGADEEEKDEEEDDEEGNPAA